MNIKDTSTPVVVVNCHLGALSIMRTLGSRGVATYGVDADPKSPGMTSRYCRRKFVTRLDDLDSDRLAEYLIGVAKSLDKKPVLIPTSDETSLYVARYRDGLKEHFLFPSISADLVERLISKRGMYELVKQHDVPTPFTHFPQNVEDVREYAQNAVFPVMLKGILGNRLHQRTGKKMVLVHTPEELLSNYRELEDPDEPNLMLQEAIPGDDDQVFIFNGYFDSESNCLVPFTGHKIRQFPVHVGCASLGACTWNEDVARLTMDFMKKIGYSGILDIGYRLDPRDGKYKVLDINPRIGQAFRMFVARNDLDVCQDLYLDLTGQERRPAESREGRRWVIEDYDIISSIDYYSEGTLTFSQWLASFKKLEEGLWFSSNDPWPFFRMCAALLGRGFSRIMKRLGLVRQKASPVSVQKAQGV